MVDDLSVSVVVVVVVVPAVTQEPEIMEVPTLCDESGL